MTAPLWRLCVSSRSGEIEGRTRSDLNEDTKRLSRHRLETELGWLRLNRSHEDASAVEELQQIVDELGEVKTILRGVVGRSRMLGMPALRE